MGRVRAGLEAWVADQPDLPGVLVEAARSLAAQVDREPRNSPLWGRLVQVLLELTGPEQQARAWNEEVAEIYRELATIEAAEAWRYRRYLRAVDSGEPDPGRWSHLVPVACAMGDHNWHRYGPLAPKRCLDCRGTLGDDGEMAWPYWIPTEVWGDEEP
jgi:hypothetical protein